MESSRPETEQTDANPMDYVTETKNFRREAIKSVEIQEKHKKEALAKCNDLHIKLLDCYDSRHFCGNVEKEFWDCYRNERVQLYNRIKHRVLRNQKSQRGHTISIIDRLLKRNRMKNKSFIILYSCYLNQ